MKKQNLTLLTATLLLTLLACSEIENSSKERVFHVDLENCNTFIDLMLSNLIDSFQLVPLETTDESLPGNYIGTYLY